MSPAIEIYENARKRGYFYIGTKIYKVKDEDEFNRLITKDVEWLDIEKAGGAFILDEDGVYKYDLTFYKMEDEYLVTSESSLDSEYPFVFEKIDKFLLLGVEGSETPKILETELGIDVNILDFKDVMTESYMEENIIISRYGFSGEFGYQFIGEKAIIENIREKLLSVDINEIPKAIKEYIEFEVGYRSENLKSRYSLNQLGLLWQIDIEKEYFVGKKSLLSDIQNEVQTIIGFKTSISTITNGDRVYFEKKPVGEVIFVTEALSDTTIQKGLLLMDKEYACSGLYLRFKNHENEIKTISSPYTVPFSWIG